MSKEIARIREQAREAHKAYIAALQLRQAQDKLRHEIKRQVSMKKTVRELLEYLNQVLSNPNLSEIDAQEINEWKSFFEIFAKLTEDKIKGEWQKINREIRIKQLLTRKDFFSFRKFIPFAKKNKHQDNQVSDINLLFPTTLEEDLYLILKLGLTDEKAKKEAEDLFNRVYDSFGIEGFYRYIDTIIHPYYQGLRTLMEGVVKPDTTKEDFQKMFEESIPDSVEDYEDTYDLRGFIFKICLKKWEESHNLNNQPVTPSLQDALEQLPEETKQEIDDILSEPSLDETDPYEDFRIRILKILSILERYKVDTFFIRQLESFLRKRVEDRELRSDSDNRFIFGWIKNKKLDSYPLKFDEVFLRLFSK